MDSGRTPHLTTERGGQNGGQLREEAERLRVKIIQPQSGAFISIPLYFEFTPTVLAYRALYFHFGPTRTFL